MKLKPMVSQKHNKKQVLKHLHPVGGAYISDDPIPTAWEQPVKSLGRGYNAILDWCLEMSE